MVGYPRRNRNSNPGRAKLSLFRYLFVLLSSQTLAAIFFSRLLFSSLRYSEIRSWRSGSFNVATYVKRSSRKGLASLFLDRQSKRLSSLGRLFFMYAHSESWCRPNPSRRVEYRSNVCPLSKRRLLLRSPFRKFRVNR